jgi:hypothetical protein
MNHDLAGAGTQARRPRIRRPAAASLGGQDLSPSSQLGGGVIGGRVIGGRVIGGWVIGGWVIGGWVIGAAPHPGQASRPAARDEWLDRRTGFSRTASGQFRVARLAR